MYSSKAQGLSLSLPQCSTSVNVAYSTFHQWSKSNEIFSIFNQHCFQWNSLLQKKGSSVLLVIDDWTDDWRSLINLGKTIHQNNYKVCAQKMSGVSLGGIWPRTKSRRPSFQFSWRAGTFFFSEQSLSLSVTASRMHLLTLGSHCPPYCVTQWGHASYMHDHKYSWFTGQVDTKGTSWRVHHSLVTLLVTSQLSIHGWEIRSHEFMMPLGQNEQQCAKCSSIMHIQ